MKLRKFLTVTQRSFTLTPTVWTATLDRNPEENTIGALRTKLKG